MEFVGGGELISLIDKERGFGEKKSRFVSQFNPTALNTIACSMGLLWGVSAFDQASAILYSNSEEALGETKGSPRDYGLSLDHLIATFQRNICTIVGGNTVLNVVKFGHSVATCWAWCDLLRVSGSTLKMAKLVASTTSNTSQQRGQTRTACCTQECCDILR